jgi:hypothetical protein
MTDRDEIRRLVLKIERGVLTRAQLKVLMAAATAAVAGHRRALAALEARIANGASAPVRRK